MRMASEMTEKMIRKIPNYIKFECNVCNFINEHQIIMIFHHSVFLKNFINALPFRYGEMHNYLTNI